MEAILEKIICDVRRGATEFHQLVIEDAAGACAINAGHFVDAKSLDEIADILTNEYLGVPKTPEHQKHMFMGMEATGSADGTALEQLYFDRKQIINVMNGVIAILQKRIKEKQGVNK